VVYATNIAMRNLAGNTHFAAKTLEQVSISRCGSRQKLERDLLFQLRVVRAIDLAHTTFSKKTQHAESFTQNRSGREPAFVRSWRGVRGRRRGGAGTCALRFHIRAAIRTETGRRGNLSLTFRAAHQKSTEGSRMFVDSPVEQRDCNA